MTVRNGQPAGSSRTGHPHSAPGGACSPAQCDVLLAPHHGGTRCRAEIIFCGCGHQPVVILTEQPDNPGLAVPAAIAALAAQMRPGLPGAEPVWIEAWQGRAIAAVLRGHTGITTYMTVDPAAPDRPVPVHPGLVHALRCTAAAPQAQPHT